MAGGGRAQDWTTWPLVSPLQPSWIMGGMLQLLLRPTPHGWEGIGLQQQVPGRGNWLQIICPLDRTAGNAEPAVLKQTQVSPIEASTCIARDSDVPQRRPLARESSE